MHQMERSSLPQPWPTQCHVDDDGRECGRSATHGLFVRCQDGHAGVTPCCLLHGKTVEAKSLSGRETLRCKGSDDCPALAIAILFEVS